jgi:hypothetical protein
MPPGKAGGEFLELERLSFRVLLSAFGEGVLVVPDLFSGAGAVEEKEVGRDACVRGEDAVGEADDGVEIKVLEQILFDTGADAIAEQ